MPRQKRYCPPGVPQHLVQRGHNRQPCFLEDDDKSFYLHHLRHYAEQYQVQLHAYVLMDNHIHLLVTPEEDHALSHMMHDLSTVYARYFNKQYERSGSIWSGRFRASLVDSPRYLLLCYRYIELNPVRAGMVESPEGYHWSSYRSNALGKRSDLLTPHDVFLSLGERKNERQAAYRNLFPADHQLSEDQLALVRYALQREKAIGDLSS